MQRRITIGGFLSALLLCVSCATHYEMTGVERMRIVVDSVFDARPDAEAARFIAPYKQKVDSIMSPIVGRTACYMSAERPESKLSNLLADILVWCGSEYNERPVFAIYNMGGIRAAFAKGDVTVGDVLDVAPFENKICFVTLTGSKVMELFHQIASTGGEAVSSAVRLVITSDGRLVSAQLDGKSIDPAASYRIATLDYVAQGNDKMEAFKSSTDINSPSGADNNVRFIITRYMQEKLDKGEAVNSRIEGRIKIEDQ